jgi:hypothetical protein
MAKNIDLQLQKLLKIKKTFWQQLSVKIFGWIYADMKKGTVQAFTSQKRATSGGAQQYSKGYKKYKTNLMRKFGRGAKKTGQGQYLKGVTKVISSSSTPNMMLTGDTIMGLEYDKSTDTSLTMSYKDKDREKIIYNEEMGRVITTLNEANQEKVRKQIEDELVKNISDWYKDKIIITIGA